eukprot:6001265-Pleurochrysis_carterae.AAC.1
MSIVLSMSTTYLPSGCTCVRQRGGEGVEGAGKEEDERARERRSYEGSEAARQGGVRKSARGRKWASSRIREMDLNGEYPTA